MNLSLIRKFVQLLAFLFMVYGSAIVGFYAADKLTNALPALACAYDAATADYCVLIPFQHQMDHRLGMVIAAGGDILQALMPTLISLLTFVAMFVLLNKAFCGWICPLGFFQELGNIIGQKLGLQRHDTLPESWINKVRPIKWAMLGLLVFILPLLAGIGLAPHEVGSVFCSICPSRILTTVANGQTDQLVVDTSSGMYLTISVIATLLFGLMMSLSLYVRQPFCRICPMLALHAVFKKIGLVRLVKNAKPRCEKCGLCAKACPMDIREIHTEMEKKDVLFSDCTLCGRCVEFCPDKDVLQMKYAVIPIIKADPVYFKKRKKSQDKWEKSNLIAWWNKRKEQK